MQALIKVSNEGINLWHQNNLILLKNKIIIQNRFISHCACLANTRKYTTIRNMPYVFTTLGHNPLWKHKDLKHNNNNNKKNGITTIQMNLRTKYHFSSLNCVLYSFQLPTPCLSINMESVSCSFPLFLRSVLQCL